MPEVPFHLQYTLNRRQRIVPHFRIWGVASSFFILSLFTFFVFAAVLNVAKGRLSDGAFFALFALLVFLLLRGLFVGIIDVILTRQRMIDVLVEDNAAGILFGGERRWLFLDGIIEIRKYRKDVWTLRHHNGAVLNIPVTKISEQQLHHIKTIMERGHTPEGIKAVIERGRRITEILNEKKRT
jgi:hypothetical protein